MKPTVQRPRRSAVCSNESTHVCIYRALPLSGAIVVGLMSRAGHDPLVHRIYLCLCPCLSILHIIIISFPASTSAFIVVVDVQTFNRMNPLFLLFMPFFMMLFLAHQHKSHHLVAFPSLSVSLFIRFPYPITPISTYHNPHKRALTTQLNPFTRNACSYKSSARLVAQYVSLTLLRGFPSSNLPTYLSACLPAY